MKTNESNTKTSTNNLTDEDLQALGKKTKNLRSDGADDQQLKKRDKEVDFTASELDIPGSELDDGQERRGSEDEENNHYSLGTEHNEQKRTEG